MKLRKVVLAAALGVLAGDALADNIYSPGELAQPHAALEGLQNCTKCHPEGQRHSQASCLACHVELKPQLVMKVGLHGRIPFEERECQDCHHEHLGKGYDILGFNGPLKSFDHGRRTGYPLIGKHAPLACKACHEPRHMAPEILSWLKARPKRTTYLGLTEGCLSCHADEHRGQLKTTCQVCHDEKGWKPVPGFDHGRTDYPLTGKHQEVACLQCHPLEADPGPPGTLKPVSSQFARYSPLQFDSCLSCHEDPHKGSLGQQCDSCHSTTEWRSIRMKEKVGDAIAATGSVGAKFHDKTRYPLRGEHVTVPCKSCHGPFPGLPGKFKGMDFDQCTDCHVDAHVGQLKDAKAQATGPACDNCHSIAGFLPPKYSLEDHDKTKFPLAGGHRATACVLCHVRDKSLLTRVPDKVTRFLKVRSRPGLFSLSKLDLRARPDQCESCHADPHLGQFATGQAPKPCKACHTDASWTTTASFDHAKDSRFPLIGKHATTACGSCHLPSGAKRSVQYRQMDMSCAACHADVHVGQFAPGPKQPTACERCHQTSTWRDLPRFVHAPPFTTYLLSGKHLDVKCSGCHQRVALGEGIAVDRYKPLPTACSGCHADFHDGAFREVRVP